MTFWPLDLGHIAVEFGGGGGFAHVVENNEKFPPYFMREIVGGLLDLPPSKWRKPKLDEEAEIIYRAEQLEAKIKNFENSNPTAWIIKTIHLVFICSIFWCFIFFKMVQAPTDYDLDEALRKLRSSIDLDLQKGIKPNELISTFQKISGSETDRKSATDQTLKLVLQSRIAGNCFIWVIV